MPIYEYQCGECGQCFEHLQKITDAPLSECPFCAGRVRKLVSNCSFQLKGTGWYVTDYAKKDSSNGKKKEPAKESGGDGSAGKSISSETSSPSAAQA